MDKFLESICTNQIMSSKQGDKYSELLEPFMSKLKEIVSDKVYCELEEKFNNCMIENNTYYAVAGMKMAVGILDGTFVPTM